MKASTKSNWLKWQKGRQQTGYSKMLLARSTFPVKFDIYFLKFPTGSEIPIHIDPVDKGKHYRLNVILKNANKGGQFICKDTIINFSRVKLFRPDVIEHSVTKVQKGNRYVFSIGWVIG